MVAHVLEIPAGAQVARRALAPGGMVAAQRAATGQAVQRGGLGHLGEGQALGGEAQAAGARILQRAQGGDADAIETLFEECYPLLSQLARARLRAHERTPTLDTGSLVHEAYLRFVSAGRLRLDDGLHFRRNPTNPVFRPGGSWNSGRAIDADVFPVGDRLFLWFATRDPAMKIQMLGVAAAPLDSDFGRAAWRQLSDAPILKPELPWEKSCIEAPSVMRCGDAYVMFYAGGYNNDPQQIGVATSPDGLQWTRLLAEPLVPNGRPGQWNSSESGHPGVFQDDDGRTFLFYQGNDDRGRTWYLSALELAWRGITPYIKTNSSIFPWSGN